MSTGKPRRVIIDDGGKTPIEIHATIAEKHTGKVALTRFPVEGSPVDHSREEPEQISIEGVVSNTPLSLVEQSAAGLVTSIKNEASTISKLLRGDPGKGAPRANGLAQDALRDLLELKSARRTVTVSGPLRRYANMVLTSFEYARDSKMGDALRFTCTFEQVRFASTSIVGLRVKETKVKDATTGMIDQGRKVAEPVSDGDGRKTTWKAIKDGVFGGWQIN